MQEIQSYAKSIANYSKQAGNYVIDSFRNTAIEVLLGAILVTSISTPLSVRYEHLRERARPLGFSEIHQIENEAKEQGKPLSKNVEYTAKLNDTCMKIFEASNRSWIFTLGNDNSKQFAKELLKKMDTVNREHHYDLSSLLTDMPKISKEAMNEAVKITATYSATTTATPLLEAAWTERHNVVSHMKSYTVPVTVTDGKGRSHTRYETRWKRVYDYTDNDYWYHKDKAQAAINAIEQVVNNTKEISWPKSTYFVKKVNEDNRKAILESRTKLDKDIQLTEKDIIDASNIWNSGSTFNQNIGQIISEYNTLASHLAKLKLADTTALPHFYKRTYVEGLHPDPPEYKVAENAKQQTSSLQNICEKTIQPWENTIRSMPELKKTIEDFIFATLDAESTTNKIDKYELQTKILSTAEKGYALNISRGFDIKGFRTGMVFLWAFLGSLAGAGLGLGINWLGDNTSIYGNLYNRRKREDEYNSSNPYSNSFRRNRTRFSGPW
jgi:hypothetical protein